jgi:D-beta-D-heptose 7-phosphate kinase / D-beta-D-heptose 1-phosphate adenosyltransferase
MDHLAHTFAKARVLVAGDVILDRYWHGGTHRISPEAPVPVVHVSNTEERPGGAANVALNIRSLGAHAAIIGLIGDDADGASLSRLLTRDGIESHLLAMPGVQTIVKLRVLSQHQQLIRLDFEDARPRFDSARLRENYLRALPGCDVVVLSDYAKGVLADSAELIRIARAAGKAVIVDPKSSDFSRYAGASIVTPNMKEFEAVVGNCEGDETTIRDRAQALCERHDIDAVLVTRSEHGMTMIGRDGSSEHMAARARDVFDVTGAGDTVCGVLAAALAAGFNRVEATRLANAAAGIVVGKLGAASVTTAELEAALHQAPVSAGFGVIDRERLRLELKSARQRGERVVMTNGCFDILHAGHVRYLREARALGDRLIVAVNDDGSVQRLKGEGRPINPLAQRMEVLAALGAVDWVVPFAEDTPEALVCALGPDVLVKGGDYRPEAIAGGDCVRARGGEVVVLGFVEGCSTTRIIAAAKAGKVSTS